MGALFAAPLHAQLIDDFSGDLSSYVDTVILDVNGGAANTSSWQIVDGAVELNTTTYDGIQQHAFVRNGLTLPVGQEVQAEIPGLSAGNQDIGLYVGGGTPVPGVRKDYVVVYARDAGLVITRGFSGTNELSFIGAANPNYDKLFIMRTGTNDYDLGYYVGNTRTVVATRTGLTGNDGSAVGFYADVRGAGVLQSMDNLRLIDPTTVYLPEIDMTSFRSGEIQGTIVGNLSATLGGTPEASTFIFVSGEGDDDNDKFQLDGDRLEIGSYDFKGIGSVDGQQFQVRVQGSSDSDPSKMAEFSVVLTVIKDDDIDNLLDTWELSWAEDLTSLSAMTGTEDFDNDQLWDIEEYQISIGTYTTLPAYPSIDPTEPDTDGDGLTDGEEVLFTVGSRAPTNPILQDTDFDGLTDFEETNSNTTETLPSVGSDPTIADTDGDGAKDGYEIANSTDPLNSASYPPSASPAVSISAITDDASTGISTGKVYTHKISGGYATTVNGVSFSLLDAATTPANFDWTVDPGPTKQQIATANLGNWDTAAGGVTGTGIVDLLSGFTYSDISGIPGGTQTYTLSGLTPGQTYQLKLYIRAWRPATDSGRPIDLAFINGSEETLPYSSLLVDRPGIVLNSGNNQQAYALSFDYTAEGSELVIDARVPLGFDTNDSFHMYGLTNEVTGEIPADLSIIALARDGAGNITITFTGEPNTSYSVTKSPDLTQPFGPLTNPLTAITGPNGIGTATVPSSETTEASEFYRIED